MLESIILRQEVYQRRLRKTERRALDARVVLETTNGAIEGWSLNASDGGLRLLVVDDDRDSLVEALAAGRVIVRVEGWAARPARVVWREMREGGAVVGLAFDGSILPVDIAGSVPFHLEG